MAQNLLFLLAWTMPLTAVAQEPVSRGTPAQPPARDNGFTPLFDGKTLAGWTTRGGRYDGNAVWTVEDGALVGRQGEKSAGGLIYTARRYGSFLLTLEAKIDYPFDSGIFLHMLPREEGDKKGLQITIDYRPNGEVGGIYADGWLHHNQEAKAKFHRDEWNRFDVRCAGIPPRVEVWLNGERITDYARSSDAGFATTGHIGLQVHGARNDPGRACFRNIRLRELPTFDRGSFTVDDSGFLRTKAGSGWTKLFNGRDLEGWEAVGGGVEGYVVRDGVLAFRKKGGGGYLRTKADFEDFRLRLDFKIARMANSGVFLRAARDGSNPAFSGCEIQILDDFNWEKLTGHKLQPYQRTGGLYGSVAAGTRALFEPGRWNSYAVTYRGTRLEVELNGQLLYDVDTLEVPGKPFADRARKGAIGLQRHAPAQVEGPEWAWFRNIFVQTLAR